MDAAYIVTFRGFPGKFEAVLEKMLRDDIAQYPKRMRMESANVSAQDAPKDAPKKKGKAAQNKAETVSKNAKS